MTRRNRRRQRAVPIRGIATPSSHSTARSWRRYGAALAAIVLVAAAVVVALGRRQHAPVAFPPPRETAAAELVRREDFTGPEACAKCHASEYAAWRSSTHGQAGGPAASARVIAAFDGRAIRFKNATVTPRRTAAGTYEFFVARDSEPVRVIPVHGVIGGGHMNGGGTQGFVTRANDGTFRFVPFDYSRDNREWFCNTGSRAERGWQPITSSLPIEACGDWPPVRVLGDVERFANCQSCHASQLDVTFDTATHRYTTRYTTLAIDCEACHGPGKQHITLLSSGARQRSPDIGMRALATLDKDQSLGVCFQCHAVKDRLRPGYLSGDSLERFYSLALPLVGDRPLSPDGRVRTFAYQENQRYSDCYLNGGMRCTDCHDPHSQQYRDVNGMPLTGRFDDRQCTSCHASKADPAAVTAHSHHPAESIGSRCVSCHMPYLQHPELGDAIRYARSDHSIPVPRPAEDDVTHPVSGCAVCHRDRSATALAAQVTTWYGTLKPRKAMIASQLLAERDSSARAGAALLGGSESGDEYSLIRAAGLARLLDRYVAGETRLIDDAVIQRLEEIAEREHGRDTRGLALALLHLTHSREPRVRRFLATALERAGMRDAALRDRWALALGYAGDRYVQSGQLGDGIAAYRLALEVRPDDAALLRSLANAERDAGDLDRAIGDYRESLMRDGGLALTLVNLAVAQAASGDTIGAVESWRRANRLDPNDALPLFDLGNIDLLQSRFDAAIAHYRAAVERDESLVPANLNLARALAAAGRYQEALRSVRRARRFDSLDASGRQLEAQLLEVLHGPVTSRK